MAALSTKLYLVLWAGKDVKLLLWFPSKHIVSRTRLKKNEYPIMKQIQ